METGYTPTEPSAQTVMNPAYVRLSAEVVSVRLDAAKLSDRMGRVLSLFGISSMAPLVGTGRRLLGVIRDRDLLETMAVSRHEKLSDWRERMPEGGRASLLTASLPKSATVAEARAFFAEAEHDQPIVPLVDEKGRYTGRCASRALLVRLLQGELRPERVGGLATPLGVYMTSGKYSAGAGARGLVALGLVFGVFVHVLDFLRMMFEAALFSLCPQVFGWGEGTLFAMQLGFLMFASLAAIRLTPLSGLHAAEHMTINAIELDLPVSVETVRRQPREHLRCGTNLMVFVAGLQMGVISLQVIGDRLSILGIVLYGLLWGLLVARFWRPAGLWLQRHFTTRPPTEAQLDSGLRAGHELLEKFRLAPHPPATFWQKLLGSGFPHMTIVFLLTSWLLALLLDTLLG